MAERYIEVLLRKRGVRAVAKLLDEEAPRTCQAVWDALPLKGAVWHAKWCNHEIYTLVPAFAPEEPGKENATVFPIPGDLLYFSIPKTYWVPPQMKEQAKNGLVDLAVFYGRNNYLLGADGHFPGNLWGTVTEGLQELAAACLDVWRAGGIGEELEFRRL